MQCKTQHLYFRDWYMGVSWKIFSQTSKENPISFPGMKLHNRLLIQLNEKKKNNWPASSQITRVIPNQILLNVILSRKQSDDHIIQIFFSHKEVTFSLLLLENDLEILKIHFICIFFLKLICIYKSAENIYSKCNEVNINALIRHICLF